MHGFNKLKKIERFILNKASSIIVTALGDKENLINKGVEESKIHIIYNGADLNIFKPLHSKEILTVKEEYNIPDNKIVLIYFGSFNYGMNDIELLGNVLSEMEKYRDRFIFLAVGDGDNKIGFLNKIKDKIDILSFSSFESEELAKLVAASDLSLIPRKAIKHDTGGNTPVKCFESWAASVPVLLSANKESEIAKIYNDCKSGMFVYPNDLDAYKRALIHMLMDVNLKSLGLRGRKFVENNFDRKEQSLKLKYIIKQLQSDRRN